LHEVQALFVDGIELVFGLARLVLDELFCRRR